MKFQLIVEVDETQISMPNKEIVKYAMDSLADSFAKTGANFDVGCSIDQRAICVNYIPDVQNRIKEKP